ncbi:MULTISPECIES: family 1 glycosylhydrolase [Subtercola]|uniref:Glycosyl hydrolase family protein n=1 Tax=Subtercola vilae TaxID=2056433 RepID=A0A4T2CCR7_9MICO|nr:MULTISPECIES: family 1 glycosylhydrolase [Subtercola]MEA9984335.1 family 1 glycosylhydrolase [Subtercola sp. RTI3]TIH40188.1 glycosyl hydrolase family protein [Subtercola vilae]
MKWFDDDKLHFALGIEDTFVPQTREGERAIDEYELTEHYTHIDTDLALATGVGAEMLRWGVPWHRVAAARGQWDWSWLDRALNRFQQLGLRPIVDLLHYGTPLWLDDQFANPDYPKHIAEFAARFAERYADMATDYTPVNEPMIHALFSGEYAYWPPYRHGPTGLITIAAALAEGFVLTQQAIAGVLGDEATFVHVDAGMRYVGDVDDPEHRETVARLQQQRFLVEDLVTGNVREGHPLLAQLRQGGVTDNHLSWFADNAVQPDVMGVNYYPLHSTEVFEKNVHHGGGFADPRPFRDAGTEGLREVLTTYADRYGAPVMLTETCVTGTVAERISWLDASVACLHELRAEGLPVVGFTWWPLFDMYEWTYRHSTNPRADHLLTMGLFDLVETGSGDLERRRNPVADRFRQLATASALSPTLIRK